MWDSCHRWDLDGGQGRSSHCTKIFELIKDKVCDGSRLFLCDTWLLERNTDCAENYWKRSFRCLLDRYVPETLALWEGHVSSACVILVNITSLNYGRALESFDESLILVSVSICNHFRPGIHLSTVQTFGLYIARNNHVLIRNSIV
jgi:hypothetical protein